MHEIRPLSADVPPSGATSAAVEPGRTLRGTRRPGSGRGGWHGLTISHGRSARSATQGAQRDSPAPQSGEAPTDASHEPTGRDDAITLSWALTTPGHKGELWSCGQLFRSRHSNSPHRRHICAAFQGHHMKLPHSSSATSDQPALRTAVIVIHGIGNQRPMHTLKEFVHGLYSTRNPEIRWHSKPDRISGEYELRRLNVPERELGQDAAHAETDFYEFYWQHLLQGTTRTGVLLWVIGLAVRRRLPKRLNQIRWATILLASFLALLLVTLLAWLLVGWASHSKAFMYGLAAVVALACGAWILLSRRVLADIIGDAARYLDNRPENIAARRAIREAGLALLRGLHDEREQRYQRVVVVGHSLGSVIAYDLLTWFWQERHALVRLAPGHPETISTVYDRDAPVARSRAADIASGPSPRPVGLAEAVAEMKTPDEWQARQYGQWHQHTARGLPWLITDLITLGSPLTYVESLVTRDLNEFRAGRLSREFPRCPPASALDEQDRRLNRKYVFRSADDEPETKRIRILHHAALFEVTRWTNLYFRGDLIGGPLAHRFGKALKDQEIAVDVRWSRFPGSHTRYWRADGEAYQLHEIWAALRLVSRGKPPF